MTDVIKNSQDRPVGFVVDIDVEIVNRWRAVQARIKGAGVIPPDSCPADGYIGKIVDYPHPFGVWLMPDCQSDGQYVEDLCITLLPSHPLWGFSIECTNKAADLLDSALAKEPEKYENCHRYKDVHRRKAHLHTWLAWQDEPGKQLGSVDDSSHLDEG